jgi:hypothetical protein
MYIHACMLIYFGYMLGTASMFLPVNLDLCLPVYDVSPASACVYASAFLSNTSTFLTDKATSSAVNCPTISSALIRRRDRVPRTNNQTNNLLGGIV